MVAAVVAGCEIVSGLNDITVPEPPVSPADAGSDAIVEDVSSRDWDHGAMEAGEIDEGRQAERQDDAAPIDSSSLDAETTSSDAPADGSARDAPPDSPDSPCVLGARGAREETPTLQGTFQMGAGADAGSDFTNAVPRHPATLDPFALDKFEVTVARFRQFVNDYACWRRTHPTENEGAVGGQSGRGWKATWNAYLGSEAELRSKLACDADAGSPRATWSETAGDASTENRPIDCVTWYEALAFCIWDEGRLPTEAEWEFAAAGGSAQRPYSTGFSAPFPMAANYDSPSGAPTRVDIMPPVVETWGTRYLAGNVAEWVFDGQGAYKASCSSTTDCQIVPGDFDPRGVRGGSWSDPVVEIQTARRTFRAPTERSSHVGFRCARGRTGDR